MGHETLPVDRSWGQSAPASSAPLKAGERISRYQVRRLLGEGGMGQVYLARDMTLGRSVALKIVRTQGASDAEDVLGEARTTARFSHPHIVQLYDCGTHAGRTYLALEYLEGESLRDRVQRERLTLDDVLRIARSIADALAHAHAAGVRHCDLKPSNVMLPRDGRLRVVDFGLASTARRSGVDIVGTPDWMAPEQWTAEPFDDGVDIWALGVIVYELLAGAHPFGAAADAQARKRATLDPALAPAPLAPDVPAPLAELVRRSLSRVAASRPSAAEWVKTLDALRAGRGPTSAAEAPYRGLAAFDASDAHLFHGRDADIDELLERLRDTPLLAIVGPSGAGKSSFLHAGVIPRLVVGDRWKVIGFRPGTDPFHTLASRLVDGARGTAEIAALAQELRDTPTLLALRLATIAMAEQRKLLLAIDQLEELFTQGTAAADVAKFIEMLRVTSDDPQDPVRVVVTLRDDFSGRVTSLRHVFVLRALGAAELRKSIVAPLEPTGFRFEEPEIVDDILRELGPAPSLPLLQFACRTLWDARDSERRVLSRAAYRDLGGVAGALARHADRFVAGLSIEQQAITRALLLGLVAETRTRRIVEREVLLSELPAGAEDVLGKLLAARLVVQRRAGDQGQVLVELAHESLLVAWGQLRRWIERTEDQRQFLDELGEAATVWSRRGEHPGATWTKDEILAARQRATQLGVVLPERLAAFLAAGDARHARQRQRARRRVVIALGVATVVTASALVVAQLFRRQRIQAELASGNLGKIELELAPFDWRDGHVVPVAARELANLQWQLYAADPAELHRPGVVMPHALVRATARQVGDALVESVEAPGGLAFLRIDGRGAPGEYCAPSWVRLEALPGYAERDQAPRRLRIPVPTCHASRAALVEIPEGDMIYGGPGEPATQFHEYEERERIVHLPRFAIDRTEVSNAAFAPFTQLAAITGYPAPVYPAALGHEHDGEPQMPVTGVDRYEAQAFCTFMGKRLPSDHEWTKAARGGVEIAGHPNPAPRRLYPWGTTFDPKCANGDGDADGFGGVAPVDAFACGASPYGVLQLAGNVAEWIARDGQVDPDEPLGVVRGGGFTSPRELEHLTTVFRNTRDPRHFDFSTGFRCVEGPELPHRQ